MLVPPFVALGIGAILLVLGVLAVVYRDALFASVIRDQARMFGERFAASRRATSRSMIWVGAGVIAMGLFLVGYALLRM